MNDPLEKIAANIPVEPYTRFEPVTEGSLLLDSNEGARIPAETLGPLAPDGVSLREYPNVDELRDEIANRFNVDPACVVLTTGADDALDRVCRAFLGTGRELLVPVPTFAMLHRFAMMAGSDVVTVDWSAEFPTDSLISRINKRTGLVAIVSPNNPTGLTATADDLRRVAAAAGDTPVLLDHVYVDYADEDLTGLALSLGNVIVVRTFSKAWGMAGGRVGYALASPTVANIIRNTGNPYPVATMSAAIALRLLKGDGSYLRAHVASVRREREDLGQRLKKWGSPALPSQGNFLYVNLPGRVKFVRDCLATLGVVTRYFPERPETDSALRISLPGAQPDFDRLVESLGKTLAPEAILFDLDGVIADVTGSYRECSIQTARSFDVAMDQRDFESAKLEADSNNDWVLTQRLMAQRGKDVPLDQIVKRYQELYMGTSDRPGLRDTERPLIDRAFLEKLAARYPLAIVTGRPREEARWFLERENLLDLFDELICMEDAPLKPDPTPVLQACRKLGITRAWMIGDSPDDMVAARAADVIPVGVLAPGTDADKSRAALEAAGAVTVLTQTKSLEDLLC